MFFLVLWIGNAAQAQYVRAWGNNWFGQATVPRDVGKVRDVAAGGLHTFVIKGEVAVQCWGSNEYGQFNFQASIGSVTAIAAGYFTAIFFSGSM